MSWWRTFLILSVVVIFSVPPTRGYATNPSYRFARAVLRVLTKAGTVQEVPGVIRRNWAEDLTAAVKYFGQSKGIESEGVTPDVIAAVKVQLETPHRALLYIEGTEMGPELLEGWDIVMARYVRGFQKIKTPLRREFGSEIVSWANHENGYIHLERYYYDQIQRRLEGIRRALPAVDRTMKREQFREIFEMLDTFFRAEPKSPWGKTRFLPEGAAEPVEVETLPLLKPELDRVVAQFDTEFDYLSTWNRRFSRNSPGWPRYVADVEELFRLVRNFDNTLRKNRVLGFQVMDVLGVADDFLLAQVRYGDPLTRKLAISSLTAEANLGSRSLSFENVHDILSVPDHDFRKFALEKFIKHGPVARPDVKTSLEALYLRTTHYFPGDRELAANIDIMTMLLLNQEEFFLEAMVVSPRVMLAERVAALRAFGWIDSAEGFNIVVGQFMNSDFRVLCLNHPEFLSAYVDVLGVMVSGTHGSHVVYRAGVVRELLKTIVKTEESLFVREQALRGFGLLLTGLEEAESIHYLSVLLKEEVPPQLQAAAIRALSKVPVQEELAGQIRPFLSSESVEVRAAAALYLSPMDEGGQRLIPKLLRQPPGEISEETLLELITRASKDDKEGLISVIQSTPSHAAKLKALTVLAKDRDRDAATLLLTFFDEASGGEKLEVIQILIGNYGNKEHKVILRKTFEHVLELYERTDIDFDLFQVCGDFMVRSRLKVLQGDKQALEVFRRHTPTEHRKLQELLSVAFEVLTPP